MFAWRHFNILWTAVEQQSGKSSKSRRRMPRIVLVLVLALEIRRKIEDENKEDSQIWSSSFLSPKIAVCCSISADGGPNAFYHWHRYGGWQNRVDLAAGGPTPFVRCASRGG